MEKKHMAIAAAVIIVIIAIVAIFATGIISTDSLMGQPPVENKTFDFEGCTLVLPETTAVLNLTGEEDSGVSSVFYLITDNSTNTTFTLAVGSGSNLVPSANDYIANLASQGYNVQKDGEYDGWTIVKDSDEDNYKYELVKVDGKAYVLSGDDLEHLKSVVDTFEKKE